MKNELEIKMNKPKNVNNQVKIRDKIGIIGKWIVILQHKSCLLKLNCKIKDAVCRCKIISEGQVYFYIDTSETFIKRRIANHEL